MSKKKTMSQKEKDALKAKNEKDALKAKREKERRAKAKKSASERHAKLKAADKVKRQNQKEKARLQKQKKKEQKAKEKSKAKEVKVKAPMKETVKTAPAKKTEDIKNNKEKKAPKAEKPAKKTRPKKDGRLKGVFSRAAQFTREKVFKKISLLFKKSFCAKHRIISICVIAAVLVAAVVPASIFSYRSRLLSSAAEGYDYYGSIDDKERKIEISEDKQLERADAVKRHGHKNKFTFFTNTEIDFEKWYSGGKLIFGNVSQNACDLVVTIFSEDGKTILYRSDGIEPGHYISEIRMFEQLAHGSYKTKMFVAGYEHDSNKLVGIQYVKIKLIVGGGQDERQS